MTGAEIEAYNIGVDTRRAAKETGDPTERIAWAVGVQLCHDGRSVVRFLTMPDYQIRTATSVRASDALYRLGHDRWAYWVRRGFDYASGH